MSDRGPGGGTLPYETQVRRFTLEVGASSGAISNFQVVQTLKFSDNGLAFNGLTPTTPSVLGRHFDPEGLVVNPVTGKLLVSDEYGLSLKEFDRSGNLVRAYTTAANLVPQVGSAVNYSAAPPLLTSGPQLANGQYLVLAGTDNDYRTPTPTPRRSSARRARPRTAFSAPTTPAPPR